MRGFTTTLLFMAFAAGLVVTADPSSAASTKKKTVRDSLSEKQKADMRKRAWEWCRKSFNQGGSFQVMKVEVLSDGRVRCWYRS